MKAILPTETELQLTNSPSISGNLISTAELRLLAAIGFFAAKSGYLAVAVRIFEALRILRPGATFPFIGLAIAYLAVDMATDAVSVLRDRGARECTDSSELSIWLSLSYHQSGNHAQALAQLRTSLISDPAEVASPLAGYLSSMLGSRSMKLDWPMPASVTEEPQT